MREVKSGDFGTIWVAFDTRPRTPNWVLGIRVGGGGIRRVPIIERRERIFERRFKGNKCNELERQSSSGCRLNKGNLEKEECDKKQRKRRKFHVLFWG